jgi:hypothetical protein
VIGLLELVSEKEIISLAATQGAALLRETVQSLYGEPTLQNVWRVMAFMAQQAHSKTTNFESNDERAVLVHAVSKPKPHQPTRKRASIDLGICNLT